MGYTSRMLWADLESPQLLARQVRRSGKSHRLIAEEVVSELRRIAEKEKRHKRDPAAVPTSCSHTLIGQLCRGQARTVHELRAVAIERVLSVDEGDLFSPRLVHGSPTAATA